MKISLITVTYNCDKTLNDTFDSVRGQNCKELEYIVIDGGSTDNTVDIIRKNDDIIDFWSSAPDEGIYDAMNKGLRQATGEYIGFLHSDDMFFSGSTLKNIVSALADSEKPEVFYGDLEYVHALSTEKVIRKWRSRKFKPELLKQGWMPPHPTLYIRKDVVEETGFFDTSYRIAADYDYILRLFTREGLNSCYLPEVIVKMRLGGASNKSLSNIIRKSKEDIRALRKNRGGGLMTLIRKNLSKIPQFFHRKVI
jgi:glycosyltransferase